MNGLPNRFASASAELPNSNDYSIIDHRWRIGVCSVDLLGLHVEIGNYSQRRGDPFDERTSRSEAEHLELEPDARCFRGGRFRGMLPGLDRSAARRQDEKRSQPLG